MRSGSYPQNQDRYQRMPERAPERGRSYRASYASGGNSKGRGRKPVPHLKDGQGTLDWIGDVVKIVLIVIVIMFCISMSNRAYEIGYSIFYEEPVDEKGSGHTVEVTVTDGMSVQKIGKLLQEDGLIKDAEVFHYQELFSSYHGKIVPGTYELSTEMTPSEMIKKMAENYKEPEESSSAGTENGASAASDAGISVSGDSAAQTTDQEGQQAQ